MLARCVFDKICILVIILQTEMKSVLDLGVSPKHIVYANPCKQISHLKYASQKSVDVMTFDNEYELYKVHKYYPCAR